MGNRDIGGQFDGFNFTQLSQGLPSLLEDFRSQWQASAEAAENRLPGVSFRHGVPAMEVRHVPGDWKRVDSTHVGAVYGILPRPLQPFGPISNRVDVGGDVGGLTTVAFSIGTLLSFVETLWSGIVGPENGGIDLSTPPNPSANGPLFLESLRLEGAPSQDRLITTIKGHAATPAGLPAIPFTVTVTEIISIKNGELAYDIASDVSLDTDGFNAAVKALEVFVGIGAVLTVAWLTGGLLTAFGVVGVLVGAGLADAAVDRAQAKPKFPVLGLLKLVVDSFPRRILVSGATKKLLVPYDRILVPSGVWAVWDVRPVDLETINATTTAIIAAGDSPPFLTDRTAFVTIDGRAQFEYPPNASDGTLRTWTERYSAVANDEVVNPVFSWIARSNGGHVLATGKGRQFAVTSDLRRHPAVDYTVSVTMSDDLGLTDISSHVPHAELQVTGQPSTTPHPLPPTIRTPRRIEELEK